MSSVSDIANLASLTTVNIEDQYGVAHGMPGCVLFGPLDFAGDDTNTVLFGVEIDQHFREAGWTLTTKNGATGGIDAFQMVKQAVRDPSTGQIVSVPLFEMNWIDDNSGDFMQGYDPATTQPPHLNFPWERGTPTWIPLGPSEIETWENIYKALEGKDKSTLSGPFPYSATFPVGDYGGHLANDRTFTDNGFFMLAGNSTGAGKTWESRELMGMKFRVKMTVGGALGNYDGNIGITITTLLDDTQLGEPVTLVMMSQSDYLFMLDPYSLYMCSRLSEFHADLFQTTNFFCTMINTPPAMPQHTSLSPIPPVALIGSFGQLAQNTGKWYVGTDIFDGTGCSVQNEQGWCAEVFRMGPSFLTNGDDSDVAQSVRLCFSIDDSGPHGAVGAMHFLGQMWNGFILHNQYSPNFMTPYSLSSSSTQASSGIVSVSGTTVTRSGGDPFDSSWVGETIRISGVPYTVSAVSSPSTLTLSAAYSSTTTAVVGTGVVDASFFGLTYVSGDTFLTAWNGQEIDLGGVPYLINSVGSSGHFMSITTSYSDGSGGNVGTNISFSVLGTTTTSAASNLSYTMAANSDATELSLPKTYYSILTQVGTEEVWNGQGAQGTVYLASADYSYLRQTANAAPLDEDNQPVGVKIQSEWNLFAKAEPTEAGIVIFKAFGGRAVNPDHSHGGANYIPPAYTWHVAGLPPNWSSSNPQQSQLKLTGFTDTSMIGSYVVTIQATDTFGNTRVILYTMVLGTPE